MKKALVIFLALALVGSVFATEPAAEVKVAEFTGDAAVTFGVNLNDGHTGFKNETSGSLKLNLLNGGDKSTTGDGVWGELQIKFDGIVVTAKNDKASELNDKKVSIETAKIHFGPVYMGILSGDFDFGGDFYYPNALNYKDKDDQKAGSLFVRNPLPELGYDQGVVIGYKHDMFSVEASLRSKKAATDKTVNMITAPTTTVSEKGKKYYAVGPDGKIVEKTGDGTKTVAALFKGNVIDNTYFTKEGGDENFWTNKYAVGVYGEVKPIKDLRVGVGFAYAMGQLGLDTKEISVATKTDDKTNDMNLFVGADYRFNFNEDFFIQPTLTYGMNNDYVWTKVDEGKYSTSHLTAFGLRFGFTKSKSSDGNSLLYDFFGKNTLYYDKHAEDKGDDMLLPGVSVFTYIHGGDKIRTDFPVMLTFYSGEMVKNLKASALFGVNVAKDASKVSEYYPTEYAYAPDLLPEAAVKGYWDSMLGGAMQAGVAASYDVKVGDITVVPAIGFLWKHSELKGKDASKITVDRFQPEFKVDVKGLVDNTTFSLFWDEAKFGNMTSHAFKIGGTEFKKYTRYENNNGVLGLKAKIAL